MGSEAFANRKEDHVWKGADPVSDGALFEMADAPKRITLHDRFLVPPLSVLDRRQGYWQDRRRQWMSLGIQSELGRDADLTFRPSLLDVVDSPVNLVSIFDPVFCELAYRWYSPPGASVLDPFAGGSVRGVVASCLERYYTGIELREEQCHANAAQAHLGNPAFGPEWIPGDSARMDDLLVKDEMFDLIFSCPPYADLEVYSDDPADISNMDYEDFLAAYTNIIRKAVHRLRDDRFIVWVISEVRDKRKKGSPYYGFVADTVKAFETVGCDFYNDVVIVDPVNTASVRAPVQFSTHRKQASVHQNFMVFVKGDPRAAAAYAKSNGGEDL